MSDPNHPAHEPHWTDSIPAPLPTIPDVVVGELVRAAFAAGRQYSEDEFEPGIIGVVAYGNSYQFVWGGPDQ